jgi:hypothetical protein
VTFISLGEGFITDGAGGDWVALGRIACDFCSAVICDEVEALVMAEMFDGWDCDRDLDRDMCPACRRRVSTDLRAEAES